MKITYEITEEESKRIIANHIRSIADLGFSWKLTKAYYGLGEYTFEKVEEAEKAEEAEYGKARS